MCAEINLKAKGMVYYTTYNIGMNLLQIDHFTLHIGNKKMLPLLDLYRRVIGSRMALGPTSALRSTGSIVRFDLWFTLHQVCLKDPAGLRIELSFYPA